MFDLLTPSLAWAGEAAGGEAAGGLGQIIQGPLPMLILMFAIFYFLLIRPQQKKAKAHKELLSNLRKGDNIVTSGGIYGKITGITNDMVVVEIAPQVRIKIARGHVSGLATGEGTPAPAPAQDKDKDKEKK
ncbi:MAG: preprotein translocase subunit YajC [Desulfarculus sp.]|nr:preprotein translocase subunit YajC [Desulfarculus sp.]